MDDDTPTADRRSMDPGGDQDGSAGTADSETDARLVSRLARGGGVGFVGRLLGKFLGVLVQVVLTRVLGPSAYGRYVLGLNIERVVQRFAQLGLGQGAVRYGSVHEDDDRLGEFVFASVVVSALSGVGAAVALYAFAGPVSRIVFDDPALEPVLHLFAFAIPFYIFLELATAYFQAFERIDAQQFLTSAVRPVVNLLLLGGAFALGFRLGGAIGAFVGAGALSALVGFALLVRYRDLTLTARLRPDRDTLRQLLRYSAPMMFIAMSSDLAMRMDRLMLGVFRSSDVVGVYNVAAMVSLQFSVVISSLISVFKPMAASIADDGDHERLPPLYNTVKKWATYGTLGLFVVVILYAGPILSVFGPSFDRGREILYVLPLLYVSGSLFGPCAALLRITDRLRIEAGNAVLLVALNVVFNLLLIPPYGAVGAAVAVVAAGVITNVLQTAAVYVIYGFHPLDGDHVVLIVVGAALLAATFQWGRPLPLVQRTLVCVSVLLAFAGLFYWQIRPTERELIERVLDSW